MFLGGLGHGRLNRSGTALWAASMDTIETVLSTAPSSRAVLVTDGGTPGRTSGAWKWMLTADPFTSAGA
jgi:hypothetical protein